MRNVVGTTRLTPDGPAVVERYLEDALAFEQVAGDVLRSSGYELLEPSAEYPTARGRRELARFRTLSRSWNLTAAAYQRSPLWRRSHPVLS